MRAWIIATGDELVEGRIVDLNGSFVAQALIDRGFAIDRLMVIGDDKEALVGLCRDAASRSVDAMVISGGLGATQDDLTREALAEWAGQPLEPNPEAEAQVEGFWRHLGRQPTRRPCPESFAPRGARIVANAAGLAPGLLLAQGGLRVLALPGVPSELRRMIADGALDGLGRPTPRPRAVRIVHAVGIGESLAAEKVGSILERGRNPLVGITAKGGELIFRIRGEAATAEAAESLVAADARAIAERLGGAVYSIAGESLAAALLAELRRRGARLALAESLTGGLIGHLLTEVPGASEVFDSDLVTYSDAEKTRLLGVRPETLRAEGAVSEAVALEMAEGARRGAGVTFSLATTGIAGPGGARPGKAVGLAHVAVAWEGGAVAEARIHPGTREEVKAKCARHALDLLRRVLART